VHSRVAMGVWLNLEQATSWIRAATVAMQENASILTDLDSAIGDGDHGVNMTRGFAAVEMKLGSANPGDMSALFKLVGMTLLSSVGGAAGPLYGGFFLELAKSCAGKDWLDKDFLAQMLEGGLADIRRRGKAEPGDKTIVDALHPAIVALKLNTDADLATTLQKAAEAARQGAEATTALQARKGRASYLAERSIGHQDPGATSCWLLLKSLAEVISQAPE
jgi:phosphoenolpyruvate---glycerone phosphotransferase subunit DhaL